MVSLARFDGSTTTFTATELETLQTFLAANRATSCLGRTDVWFVAAAAGLFLGDIRSPLILRVSQVFEVQADPALPFGVGFASDATIYDLDGALHACGYAGPSVVQSDLPKVFCAFYGTAAGAGYVVSEGSGVSLVLDEGSVGSPHPAQLRSIVGIDNVTVSANGPVLTVGLGQPCVHLSAWIQSTYVVATLGEGASLVAAAGSGRNPGQMKRLRVSGGLMVTEQANAVSLSGPLPITSVSSSIPLLQFDPAKGYLRGIRQGPGMLIGYDDHDVIIGTAPLTDQDTLNVGTVSVSNIGRLTADSGVLYVKVNSSALGGYVSVLSLGEKVAYCNTDLRLGSDIGTSDGSALRTTGGVTVNGVVTATEVRVAGKAISQR